jgi:predicted transcriptional regulator
MAKTKTFEIELKEAKGAFNIFKSATFNKDTYDFSSLLALRQLLSNEKARILDAIKTKKPSSVYELAKILNRGFKSVNDDVKLLKRFGVINLVEENFKNRKRLRPVIVLDKIVINLSI